LPDKRAALLAENIHAGYGSGDIIHGVSVRAAAGQVASIVGPNGSGKSTLLKAVTGVVRVSKGRVLAGERDITRLPPEEVARAGVGYVPQVDDVFAPLTVRENLAMGGYLLGRREAGARADRVLTVFPRLAQMLNRRAGKLSGGERKMLAMGRVLMLDPAVFLLDEPTANLAPKIAAELLSEHVRALAEAGAAVLIVEQRARAVLAISDRTYVLGGGRVLMEGTPAELSASPAFTESFLGGTQTRMRLASTFGAVRLGGGPRRHAAHEHGDHQARPAQTSVHHGIPVERPRRRADAPRHIVGDHRVDESGREGGLRGIAQQPRRLLPIGQRRPRTRPDSLVVQEEALSADHLQGGVRVG